MIICKSIRIKHELNMNWYDAARCNKVQDDGDTMQYEQYGGDGESIRLRYDVMRTWQELIGTYTNQCKHVRSNTTMRSLHIVLQRTESQQTGGEHQCMRMYNESIRMYNDEMHTNRNWYKLIRRSAMQYDAIRIDFDSKGQYECFEHFKTFALACELIRKWQRTNTR